MKIEPKEFESVPINTNQRNPSSPPEQKRGWRGIVIRAPRMVMVDQVQAMDGAFTSIPICGFFVADAATAPQGAMILHARNVATAKTFSGEAGDQDPSPDEPPPRGRAFTAKQLEGVTVEGYFNPNLAKHVKIPQESATYEVLVEFGNLKSNTVVIEVVKP